MQMIDRAPLSLFCGSASFLDALSHTAQLWSFFSPSKALAAALHPLHKYSGALPAVQKVCNLPLCQFIPGSLQALKPGGTNLREGLWTTGPLLPPPSLPPSPEEITEDEVEAAPKGIPGPRPSPGLEGVPTAALAPMPGLHPASPQVV